MAASMKSSPSIPQTDAFIRWVVVLAALLEIAVTTAFFVLRLTGPVDGARLDPNQPVWRPDGIIVTPILTQPGGLKPGDLVTAVTGRSMQAWAQALFDPRQAPPQFQKGQVVPYQVVRNGQTIQVNVTYGSYPPAWIFTHRWGTLLFVILTQLVGTFVFLRRPGDPSARLLFLWGWLTSHTYAWSFGLMINDLLTRTPFWLYSLLTPLGWTFYWAIAVHFTLVFPVRRPEVQRHPRIIPAIYLAAFTFFVISMAITRLLSATSLEWLGYWRVIGYIIALICNSAMIIVLIWTIRSDLDPVARQKIRWAIYGAFIAGGGGLLLWIAPAAIIGHPLINENLFGLMLTIFPITLAIAILRHHLFDIDRLINRTLVYGALTALLVGIYFISVVVLQGFFRLLTGQTSSLAEVVSTLAIAAVFTPLRRWVQEFIDRRFYRQKYNAEQALAKFAEAARAGIDLEQLSSQVVRTVQTTLQPERTHLWLRHSIGTSANNRNMKNREERSDGKA